MDTDLPGAGGNESASARNQLYNWIAVTVALLSSFMAVTKVKDDNIVQAMLQAKSDAVDTWNEYQSKKIKEHLLEASRDQSETLGLLSTSPEVAAKLSGQIAGYEREIKRYQSDEEVLQKRAKDFEASYDTMNYRDDQFDLSDAALSISLGMLAVTALTGKRWLFGVSLVFALFGAVMGIAGLCGLHLHPDWITKLLS